MQQRQGEHSAQAHELCVHSNDKPREHLLSEYIAGHADPSAQQRGDDFVAGQYQAAGEAQILVWPPVLAVVVSIRLGGRWRQRDRR